MAQKLQKPNNAGKTYIYVFQGLRVNIQFSEIKAKVIWSSVRYNRRT